MGGFVEVDGCANATAPSPLSPALTPEKKEKELFNRIKKLIPDLDDGKALSYTQKTMQSYVAQYEAGWFENLNIRSDLELILIFLKHARGEMNKAYAVYIEAQNVYNKVLQAHDEAQKKEEGGQTKVNNKSQSKSPSKPTTKAAKVNKSIKKSLTKVY